VKWLISFERFGAADVWTANSDETGSVSVFDANGAAIPEQQRRPCAAALTQVLVNGRRSEGKTLPPHRIKTTLHLLIQADSDLSRPEEA